MRGLLDNQNFSNFNPYLGIHKFACSNSKLVEFASLGDVGDFVAVVVNFGRLFSSFRFGLLELDTFTFEFFLGLDH